MSLPFEAGTCWTYRISGVLCLPFALALILAPLWAPVADARYSPRVEPFSLWEMTVFVLVLALCAGLGLLLLLSAMTWLIQRVKADEIGLHVRFVSWRHYPWDRVRCQNLIPLITNEQVVYTFVPGDYGEGADAKTPGWRAHFWGYCSPYAFSFNAFGDEAGGTIRECIHAHLPKRISVPLPEQFCFRTRHWPLGLLVRLDASGLTVRSGMTERHLPWSSAVGGITWRLSPSHSYWQGLGIRFADDTVFEFERLYPLFWTGRVPDKAVMTEFFHRYTKLGHSEGEE